MKLILYIGFTVLIAFNTNKLYPEAQRGFSDTNYTILYQNTVDMIYEFYKKNCCSGFLDDSISKSAYYILFKIPNNHISVKRKIDLIVLIRQYNNYATNRLGNKIRREYLKRDSINTEELLFILPFATCYYCDSNELYNFCKLIQLSDTIEIQRFVPPDLGYIYFYKTLIKDIKSICKREIDPANYSSQLLNFMIINSTNFKNEFPQFFR